MKYLKIIIMILHTKIMRLIYLFTLLMLFSCKKSNASDIVEKEVIKTQKKQIIKERDNWLFYRTISLSPNSYSCTDEKIRLFQIDVSNDSIYINNKYTDDVYTNKISPQGYFEHKYLYESYVKIFKKEFNLDFPKEILTIRNKKVYDKNSELDKYFQDAFFINEYMFYEKDGCIVCLKKKTKNNICFEKNSQSFPYDKKHPIENIKYKILECDIIGAKEFSCSGEALRYISLPSYNDITLILVPQDCGDNPYRFFLLTVKDNKIISNLYVEGELVDPENAENAEVTNFSIDKDYIIKVKTLEKVKGETKSEIVNNYEINELGKLIKV
ncbi:hypothetical protein AR687_20480 [Flavobacteriaceae bacterium CRH]|nr:hypothetical protein AR687_20480 [Flavobacteriaceae bacterium CRH]